MAGPIRTGGANVSAISDKSSDYDRRAFQGQ